jgi:hypothetical protein
MEKLSTIEGPLSELEDLILLYRDDMWLILPRAFQWGPRLRRLHLTRIPFTAQVIQHLHSSKSLVDLRLHEVLCLSRSYWTRSRMPCPR